MLTVECGGTVGEVVQAVFAVQGWLEMNPGEQAMLAAPADCVPWLSWLRDIQAASLLNVPRNDIITLTAPPDTDPRPLAPLFSRQIGAVGHTSTNVQWKVPHHPQLTDATYGVVSTIGLPFDVSDRVIHTLKVNSYDADIRPAKRVVVVDHRPLILPDMFERWEPGEMLDVGAATLAANASWVVSTDNRVLHFALLASRSVTGIFCGSSATRYMLPAHTGIGLVPHLPCYPCTGECSNVDRRTLRPCTIDVKPRHIIESNPTTHRIPWSPASVQARRLNRSDLLVVMPYLSPGGGERSTLCAIQGLTKRNSMLDISVVVTGDDGHNHHFRQLLQRYLHLNLHDMRQKDVELAKTIDVLKPRSIMFYNNDLTLQALRLSKWKPRRVVFVNHTVVCEGEKCVWNSPKALDEIDTIIAVSEATRQHILNTSTCDPHVVTVRNGVPIPDEPADGRPVRESLGIPDAAFVVGYLGRFDPAKGISEILAAFNTVSRDIHDIYLIMAGWGPMTPQIQAASNGNERIKIHPPTAFVDPVFAAMDLCVLPTKTEGGIPYTLMECMAQRTPVACTDIADLCSLFKPDEEFLLIRSTSDSVAAAMREMSRQRLNYMAEAALGTLRSELSIKSMGDGYYDVLFGGLK